jgi:purine-binding chemotaxis protein CheW
LYGIDTRQIREVLGAITPQRVPLAPDYIAGMVPYRGEILTTVSLRMLLGLERRAGASCALVLDDEDNKERLGLMVDRVGGVVTLTRNALEPNPSTLDARSMALFDGAYRIPSGLMIRLDASRLRPSQLAESGLFGAQEDARTGEPG